MAIKNVSIIGMGALGILFGQHFTEKMGNQSVAFVANEKRIEKFKHTRVHCNGKECDFRMVSDWLQEKPADLVIFAVKSTALDEALETAKYQIGKDTIIISLLNGISSEQIIGARFGMEKIIHCVALGMDAVKTGNDLTYTKMGQLCVGILPDDTEKVGKLNTLCEFFDEIGLPYTKEDDILHRLWNKFMLNVGVNQAVMVYEGTYETIQKPGEAREVMIGAMREVMELAHYEGVKLTIDDLMAYVDLMGTLSPDGMPSMRQDGLAKRKSEVELFSGTVLKLAEKHGLKFPINTMLYEKIHDMETGKIVQSGFFDVSEIHLDDVLEKLMEHSVHEDKIIRSILQYEIEKSYTVDAKIKIIQCFDQLDPNSDLKKIMTKFVRANANHPNSKVRKEARNFLNK
ncbi:MAG: ketopantoate reductase family protein [Clostridia bacterium]|nr:ketopantoate reductase family protein [Clostridia bacterium]